MLTPSNLVRVNAAPAFAPDDCRLLVESVVDHAIFMLDPEGIVSTWNLGAERIEGYGSEEIVGRSFEVFYPPDDVAAGKPRQQLDAAVQQDRVETEGWCARKGGAKFWATVVVTALREPGGQLRGFGVVIRDLTDRRAAEERLRRAEERWHHLVDAVVDYAIFMLDPEGRISSWNVGATRVQGFPAEEIMGQHFAVLHTAEDRAAGKPQQLLEAVRRDGRYEDEGWRVRKDGTRFWANVIVTALRDSEGQLLGYAKITRDSSARRTADEELRRSEERFRLLVENVAEYAIYLLDPEGRVSSWNLGAQRMKGYSAQEIIGRNFACFFPPEDVASSKPERELAIARERGRFEDEGWRMRKDGSRFWANAVLTRLENSQGKLIGFAKITRDLTRHRQSEEAERKLLVERTAREVAEQSQAELRYSREQYRALSRRLEIVLEGVADGITVEDRSGRIVFANAAARKMWGLGSGNEPTRASVAEIMARFETLDAAGKPFREKDFPTRRVFEGAESPNAVLQVRERSSQRNWWLLVRAGAVLDAEGNPELAVSIWHDITAQRRQEVQTKYLGEATAALGSSLLHSEMLGTLVRILVPGMGDWCSIYLLEQGQLREVAAACADPERQQVAQRYLHSFSLGAEHAGGVWSVVYSGAPAVFNDIDEQILRKFTADPQALEQLRASGMSAALFVPLRVRHRVIGALALVYGQPGRRYDDSDVALLEELGRRAGVAVDNAQLFEAAQDALQRAEEAGRAKDEFLAVVSHELRTPLSAILGWSTLLKDRVKDTATARPIEVIHRNALAQVRIIDDILDVSRVITGKFRLEPKPMDLVAVAREALEIVRPSAEAKKIQLSFTPGVDSCSFVADPERLQQVIWNLLSNAVKFTEPGGRVLMTLACEATRVMLAVEDDGRGIEPAFLPFVFERFKQAEGGTTRRVGGLGLGLALVRHITELHGGQVTADSPGLGQGAKFTLSLPIRADVPADPGGPRAASRQSGESSGPGTRMRGARVLVVDDEPDACELTAMVLSQAGARVATAGSAAQGLEVFERFRPDVLVSDIGMPGEDGYSFVRRIRARDVTAGGKIPAVALTAFAQEEDRSRALAAGFTTYLRKPVEPEVLASTIAELAGAARQP